MKTLNTFLTLSLLVFSSASFAVTNDNRTEIRSKVPVALSVWQNAEIDVPELLKYVKAKNARVPVTGFVWGDPSEAPAQLLMVPLAPFDYGDSDEEAPQELGFVKARFANVPLAPFDLGDPTDRSVEISLK